MGSLQSGTSFIITSRLNHTVPKCLSNTLLEKHSGYKTEKSSQIRKSENYQTSSKSRLHLLESTVIIQNGLSSKYFGADLLRGLALKNDNLI